MMLLALITAPIVATSCTGGVTSIELTEHASYEATFRNSSAVAADEIRVVIPYGRRRLATFDVKQAFPANAATSVHLHKNLAGGLYAYETDRNDCRVQYVHFVDGTSWSAPDTKT